MTEINGPSGPSGVFVASHVTKANSFGTGHAFLRFNAKDPARKGRTVIHKNAQASIPSPNFFSWVTFVYWESVAEFCCSLDISWKLYSVQSTHRRVHGNSYKQFLTTLGLFMPFIYPLIFNELWQQKKALRKLNFISTFEIDSFFCYRNSGFLYPAFPAFLFFRDIRNCKNWDKGNQNLREVNTRHN